MSNSLTPADLAEGQRILGKRDEFGPPYDIEWKRWLHRHGRALLAACQSAEELRKAAVREFAGEVLTTSYEEQKYNSDLAAHFPEGSDERVKYLGRAVAVGNVSMKISELAAARGVTIGND